MSAHPLREPAEESVDLYPGLVVWDARVTGSITLGPTRLPLWAIMETLCRAGWAAVEHDWQPSQYGWDAEQMAQFLYCLTEARGELGRLLLVIADVERRGGAREHDGWWTKRDRTALAKALRRALACVEPERGETAAMTEAGAL